MSSFHFTVRIHSKFFSMGCTPRIRNVLPTPNCFAIFVNMYGIGIGIKLELLSRCDNWTSMSLRLTTPAVTLRNRKFLPKYIPVQSPGAKMTTEHDLGLRWTTPSTRVTLPAFSPPLQDQMAPLDEPTVSHPTTQIGTSPGAHDEISTKSHSTPGPHHLDVNRQPSISTSPARAPTVSPTPISPKLLPAAVHPASLLLRLAALFVLVDHQHGTKTMWWVTV